MMASFLTANKRGEQNKLKTKRKAFFIVDKNHWAGNMETVDDLAIVLTFLPCEVLPS
jgi:hypothetical protein